MKHIHILSLMLLATGGFLQAQAIGDGKADDTAAIQKAVDAGGSGEIWQSHLSTDP
jgi:outer membrane lipoprotein SlyB